MDEQVISKQRVADHGEVLTGVREVNAMLDLVVHETENIESRFLEPACGNGNFLAEILRRKLRVVESRYRRSQLDYERYAVLAVSSIYGIDILEDNVQACRKRLFAIFDQAYTGRYKKKARDECRRTVRYILGRNIIWGDALTLKTPDGQGPIVFSQWSFADPIRLKRHDFTFHEVLLEGASEPSLFSGRKRYVSDRGETVFFPESEREFPPTHFLEVARVDEESV